MPLDSTPKCRVLGSGEGGTDNFLCINPNPLESCNAVLQWSRCRGNDTEELQLELHVDGNAGAEMILIGDTVQTGHRARVGNCGEVEPINGTPPLCRHPARRTVLQLLDRLGECGAAPRYDAQAAE